MFHDWLNGLHLDFNFDITVNFVHCNSLNLILWGRLIPLSVIQCNIVVWVWFVHWDRVFTFGIKLFEGLLFQVRAVWRNYESFRLLICWLGVFTELFWFYHFCAPFLLVFLDYLRWHLQPWPHRKTTWNFLQNEFWPIYDVLPRQTLRADLKPVQVSTCLSCQQLPAWSYLLFLVGVKRKIVKPQNHLDVLLRAPSLVIKPIRDTDGNIVRVPLLAAFFELNPLNRFKVVFGIFEDQAWNLDNLVVVAFGSLNILVGAGYSCVLYLVQTM